MEEFNFKKGDIVWSNTNNGFVLLQSDIYIIGDYGFFVDVEVNSKIETIPISSIRKKLSIPYKYKSLILFTD